MRKLRQEARKSSTRECSRNKPEKPGQNTSLNAAWHQEGAKYEECRCQNCMSTGTSRKTEKNGKESCRRGTVKRCTLIGKKTREVQEKKIEYFKKKGDRQFTMDGRQAEVTVDLVLRAWAKMSDNKISGPKDAMVSEMVKILPLEKFYTTTRCFQERFVGQMNAPEGARDLEKTSYWRSQQDKLSTSASVGNKFVPKTLGLARRDLRHGSVIRPTMFVASLDIKTAFDEVTHCENYGESQHTRMADRGPLA